MKKQLLTVAMAIFFAGSTFAEEIPVDPSNYSTYFNSANDGDVLLLESGTYTTRLYIPYAGKTITLKAAEGAAPVLNWEWRSNEDDNSGGVILDGVTIDLRGNDGGNANYVFNITSRDIQEITFRNCIIQNIARCLIRSIKSDQTASASIGKIAIENCIIRECGTGRYNLIYTPLGVKEVTITNSTLYNYNQGESLFCTYSMSNPENVLNFTFENNTVYNWSGATAGRALAKVAAGFAYSPHSTYTFRNNIINGHAATDEANIPAIVDIEDGIVTAENNLIVDYGGYLLSAEAPATTPSVNDLALEGLGLTSIGFADPGNGDFTIESSSPIAVAGVNGVCLGDPRWVQTGTAISNVMTDPELVNVYSIDGIMLLQNATPEEAVRQLPRGLYIVGKRKIFITEHK